MGLFSSGLLGLFYLSLLGASFVSYSVGYCLLLLAGVLSFCGFIYLSVGFSWYLVLFCLVYVGGVYVLLVYVSMYSPNFFVWFGCGYSVLGYAVLFFCVWESFISSSLVSLWESSHYLCLGDTGFNYCFFCLVLLIGFCLVSMVSCGKDSFFR